MFKRVKQSFICIFDHMKLNWTNFGYTIRKIGSIGTFSFYLPHLRIRILVRVQFKSNLGNTACEKMKDCKTNHKFNDYGWTFLQ